MIESTRFSRILLIVAACGSLAPLISATLDESSLEPVPDPAVDSFETQVREQLLTARRSFDRQLEDGGLEGEELGRAYGELGRLYLLYDLMEPAEACFENARSLQPGDFRWPHLLGYLMTLEGRYPAARAELEAAVQLNPSYVPGWVRLGDVERELQNFTAATASYRRALELDSDNPAALFGLGFIAHSSGDHDQAIALFEQTLELEPEADRVNYLLAMSYRELGDTEQARRHLQSSGQQAVTIDDPLVAALATLITGSSIHFELGKEALIRGDYPRAAQQFRQVVEIEPNDYLAYYNLSVALFEMGDRAGAEAALDQALAVNPKFRNAHFNLATMAAEEGRFDEAATHFEAAHRIDPEDARAHLDWTTALSRVGEEQRAVEELRRLLERHPGQHEAKLNLGILLAAQGREAEAEECWTELLNDEVEPVHREAARLSLAQLSDQRGDSQQALRHYRAVLEIDPRSQEALAGLANTLGRLGRFSEASDAFGELVRLDPENLRSHFGRAMSLILDGQYADARRALESSLQALPGTVALENLLARLLATCPDEAVRDGERALVLAEAVVERELTLEHAETLAMALAEQGRFDEAILWERRVLEEAERRGDVAQSGRARSRLALYESGRKVREPWREGQ